MELVRQTHAFQCHLSSRETLTIAILTVASPIVINVPTRGLLAVARKESFVPWLAKFKYQKTCLSTVSIAISDQTRCYHRPIGK